MGWLRDLMAAATPPIRSLDQLARLCLESPTWPESCQMQARSLGAIFGKLDRDEELDWLAGRPEVRAELARLLGASRDTIDLGPRAPRTQSSRWLTWVDLPYARGLDLVEEELFPGLPAEVLRPNRSSGVVWVAPSGAGRTLVGRWLAARGLAEVVALQTFSPEALPRARPLFVELESGEGLEPAMVEPGVIVAVPEPWSGGQAGASVHSTPIAESIAPLVAWACERLPGSSRVEPAALAASIGEAATLGVVESAGDVLGLVGVADVSGTAGLDVRALGRVARDWFRRRVSERLDRDAPHTAWLRREGFEVLVSLVRRVMTDERQPFGAARSWERWSELMPAELRHDVDVEWLKLALPRAEPNLRLADLERASEKLPPGAFRTLRAFERMGLLERVNGSTGSEERLALRPHWLLRAVRFEALERLVSAPAFDWGEALLSPVTAAATCERLLERALRGKLADEELVDPDARTEPAYAAAVEGAVRALGIAALHGVVPASESLEVLWDEQLRLLLELPRALPLPRVDYPDATRLEPGAWLLERGSWYLAVLALTEGLAAHEGRAHPVLRPWRGTQAVPELSDVLDAIAGSLERAPEAHAGAALGLVARLRALLGPLGPLHADTGARTATRSAHRLERASIVADEAALGVLTWSSLQALQGDRLAALGLSWIAEHRGLGLDALGRAVWDAFAAAGLPADAASVLGEELVARLLPTAPPVALSVLAGEVLKRDGSAAAFSEEQWRGLLGAELRTAPLDVFRRVPETLCEEATGAAIRAGRQDALRELWRRFPGQLRTITARALQAGEGTALDPLFSTAPAGELPHLVEQLSDVDALLRAPLESLTAVRRFLHARIRERGPALRAAYGLFHELERRCAPVRNASLRP